MMNKTARIIFLLSSVILTATLASCISLASDITPPPGYVTPVPQPTPVPVYPIVPPSPTDGKAIYTEKCAPCHGDTGMGDGPMASSLSNPPAALASPAVARAASPMDWFNTVTNGNMEQMMPPFSSLTDRQRWDVVAYALSLSASQDQLTSGKEIYTAQCASCHGEAGKSTSGAADWSDPVVLAQTSNQQLFDALSNGQGNMPAYADKLNETDRWAVTDYVRSLSFASASEAASIATEAATPQATTAAGTPEATAVPGTTQTPAPLQPFEIQGKVNLPGGVTLPAGTKATLQGYDNMNLATTLEADVAADGTFDFKDIEPVEGRVYMTSVTYNGLQFNSNVVHLTDVVNGQPVKVDITVQLTTTDTSVIRAKRMHVFFNISNATTIQVIELYVVSNSSDRVLVPAESGKPLLEFTLPTGATNLQFQDGTLGDGVYVATSNGFGDTRPVSPGDGTQVLFAYDLPYTDKLNMTLPIAMPVDAAVVMVPEGLTLKSSQLTSSGQSTMSGMNLEVFTASNLAQGSTIKMTVSTHNGTSASTTTNILGMVIGGVALALALGGAVFLIVRQRKNGLVKDGAGEESDEPQTSEGLMDAIIALDDLHNSGKIPNEAYHQRRAELKSRLAALQGKE